MEPSEPTTWERRLLERFSETACVEDRAALALQLANASIRRRTNEYIDLEVPESLRVGSAAGYPVDAWYPDDDGTPVFMILHLVERSGQLSSLERYRADGAPIKNLEPDIRLVQVKPYRVLGPGERCGFTPEEGWFIFGPD